MFRRVILLAVFFLFSTFALAQDAADMEKFSKFEGCRIGNINVSTVRINSSVVKNKFLLKEGDAFSYPAFDYARKALHDMKVFKDVNCEVSQNPDGTVDINIDAKDSYYVFPIAFAAGGGGKTTFAGGLLEANLFKKGELGTLFAAGNEDGFIGMAGLVLADNAFSVMYGKFDYDEKVFSDGSYNTSGLFANGDDGEDEDYINTYRVRRTNAMFSYGRSFAERYGLSVTYIYSQMEYGQNAPDDFEYHNRLVFGAKTYKNIKPSKGMAGAFGSIFGLGTSDVGEKIADLPYRKYGYFAGLDFEGGGAYTGADSGIYTLMLRLTGNLEFKNRNVLWASLNSAKNFEGGFADQIKSRELLPGKGRYSREFRGEEGVGAGFSTQLYLLKNRTAVLILEPFAETAYLWDNSTQYNQTGVGAGLYVMFWRFQFPLGLNFTADTSRGDNTVSFMFGGGF